MSRYIDAEALKDTHYNYATGELVPLAWADIDTAPHIDIVRCKECKWYDADTDWANIPYCDKHHIEAYEDGFCSYGEREGE